MKYQTIHTCGDGLCTAPLPRFVLPAAFHWITPPTPCGGHINRNQQFADHCPVYQRGEDAGNG